MLIHGLAGSENSDYIRWSAAYHLGQGRRVLRLNLRGAGPSRTTCGEQYHFGSAADIRDALTALEGGLIRDGLFLVGYSLGGNILINVLSARADGLPIRGAATVSAPIDPAQAARRLMAPVNALYHKSLLKQMKRECTASGARISQTERHAIASARTLYDFDNTFTAVRNGYANADDYYARTAGWRVVPDIQIPTLLIQACNDPWIPLEPYVSLAPKCPSNVRIVQTDGGGHVGFHGIDHEETWHDRCIGAFLEALDCRPFKPV